MPLNIGDAFQVWDLDEECYHIHAVISAPNSENKVLCVNFSSIKGNNSDDNTCIVETSEFGELTRQSFIPYSRTKIIPVEKYDELLVVTTQEGVPMIIPCTIPAPPDLITRIQGGLTPRQNVLSRAVKNFLGIT